MNWGIDIIINNLHMSFENIIMLILMLGSLVFFARDFKTGIIMVFTISGAVFMWFYHSGYQWQVPLIIFFMSLIIMSLSLYATARSAHGGQII